MTVVRTPEVTAARWEYAALKMKECLEEFFRTARRPKGLNPMLCGAFEDLLVPGIFYIGPNPDPTRKDAPKQVRDRSFHDGVITLTIAVRVLRAVDVRLGDTEQAATHLRRYRRTLRLLRGLSQLKAKDRPELEKLKRFIDALASLAQRVSSEKRNLDALESCEDD